MREATSRVLREAASGLSCFLYLSQVIEEIFIVAVSKTTANLLVS